MKDVEFGKLALSPFLVSFINIVYAHIFNSFVDFLYTVKIDHCQSLLTGNKKYCGFRI